MAADAEHVTDFFSANTMGNIFGNETCRKDLESKTDELKLEKKAIQLFLKHGISDDDFNPNYNFFKNKRSTMQKLQSFEKMYATKTLGGTQTRRQRRTRRNGFFKS